MTVAIIVAPGLVNLGVPKMAAHMFIFHMGVTGDLTPPTCLSPFAAAATAGVGLLVLVLVVQTLRGRPATPHAVGAPTD